MDKRKRFDRTTQDVGNVIEIGHVNTRVPDQLLATVFYVAGLGLTRDPFLMVDTTNMWVNIGRHQFHLPTTATDVWHGHVGLVVPDLAALRERLARVKARLHGTKFAVSEGAAEGLPYVEATSPWGNRIRCFEPAPQFGPVRLGLAYVENEVAAGGVEGIAHFYREMLATNAIAGEDQEGRYAKVGAGTDQLLVYREIEGAPPPLEGYHVQVYLADFSGPYKRLGKRGLISLEVSEHEYRFDTIIDLKSGRELAKLEHEVRSMRHPLYGRHLVNREPSQSAMSMRAGGDTPWWLAQDH